MLVIIYWSSWKNACAALNCSPKETRGCFYIYGTIKKKQKFVNDCQNSIKTAVGIYNDHQFLSSLTSTSVFITPWTETQKGSYFFSKPKKLAMATKSLKVYQQNSGTSILDKIHFCMTYTSSSAPPSDFSKVACGIFGFLPVSFFCLFFLFIFSCSCCGIIISNFSKKYC